MYTTCFDPSARVSVPTLLASIPGPVVGWPWVVTGGQVWAQASLHLLAVAESGAKAYSVRPCSSLTTVPRFVWPDDRPALTPLGALVVLADEP